MKWGGLSGGRPFSFVVRWGGMVMVSRGHLLRSGWTEGGPVADVKPTPKPKPKPKPEPEPEP
jgi:hypothetical protein